MLDMAWLSSHKQIRLPKYYLEDGIYLPHKSKNKDEIEKYFLTKDKILKEDNRSFFLQVSIQTGRSGERYPRLIGDGEVILFFSER